MLEAIDAEIAERPEPVDYEGAIARMEVLLKDLEEARDYAKGWSDRAKKAELELAAEKASRKLDGMPDYAPIPVCDPLPRNFVREMPPLVKGGDDGSSDMA
jgi:hypothetical protein